MNLDKLIKRRYPKDFKEILKVFNEETLKDYVKDRNYHIGRLCLTLNEWQGGYLRGTLCLFHAYHSCDEDGRYTVADWDYNVIIKCKKGFTASGYHSITLLSKSGLRKIEPQKRKNNG